MTYLPSMINLFSLHLMIMLSLCLTSRAADPLAKVGRVVFLGDSITYAGTFIADTEAYLTLSNAEFSSEFLNLGLPSETVSGLSEPGHAGGAFPRPTLLERLDRVLAQTKPDLIVVCYGMNDGIYSPFAEDRFEKYQAGIKAVRAKAATAGAKVLHLTPPVFDSLPIREQTLPAGLEEYRQPFVGYDDVLARYSSWLLDQRAQGWDVVDIHGPMRAQLDKARVVDPLAVLAKDGVHCGPEGHWLIAHALLKHWNAFDTGAKSATTGAEGLAAWPQGKQIRALVGQRQEILKHAWLSAR